jgi:hypothetical protein
MTVWSPWCCESTPRTLLEYLGSVDILRLNEACAAEFFVYRESGTLQRCTGGPPVAPPLDLSPATSARCRASLCSAMQRPGSLSVASQDSEAIKSTSFLILPSPLATNGPFRLNNKPGLTFFCCHFVADFFSSPCCCISRHRRKTAPIF